MSKDIDVESIRADMDRLRKSQADIEQLLQQKRILLLQALPATHGFADMDALIFSLARFASSGLRKRIGVPADNTQGHGKGRRYGRDVRIAVRKALEADLSPTEISRIHGVSLPTIFHWRNTWGLTSKRSRKDLARKGSSSTGTSPSNGASVEHNQQT